MNKTYYVCKYTPIELLEAFGGECQNLNEMPQGFDHADQIAHPNICGFGKALLEAVMSGKVKELVLVNCCDTIRSVYDILEDSGKLDFLYMIDMLHCDGECSREDDKSCKYGNQRIDTCHIECCFRQVGVISEIRSVCAKTSHTEAE